MLLGNGCFTQSTRSRRGWPAACRLRRYALAIADRRESRGEAGDDRHAGDRPVRPRAGFRDPRRLQGSRPRRRRPHLRRAEGPGDAGRPGEAAAGGRGPRPAHDATPRRHHRPRTALSRPHPDRKSVVWGKSGYARVDTRVTRTITKKKHKLAEKIDNSTT